MLHIIDEYSEYLTASGASENTVLSYSGDIRLFAAWLESCFNKTDIFDINQAMTDRYIEELSASKKSSATVSRYITALRGFFSWAYANGYIFSNPTAYTGLPKVIKKTPTAADTGELERLISAAGNKTAKGIRDTAIMRLISSVGISSAELITLKITDVELKKKRVYAGIKEKRELAINKKTASSLERYIFHARDELMQTSARFQSHDSEGELRKSAAAELLFINCSGGQLSRQGLRKIINTYSDAAGLDIRLTPEMLRHSYAVNAIRAGEDMRSIQKKLGHITDSSSSEYAELALKKQ